MLSVAHKANILRPAGIAVPPPSMTFLLTQHERADAMQHWESTVENLFVSYAAARAAKSLRDAEEQRQLSRLQLLAQRSTACASA